MIDEVKRTNNIDSTQVYITGLSAGAAMAVVMMADYPETFNTGAIFAGGAYKTATNLWTALLTFYGWRIKSPDKWAELVREHFDLRPKGIVQMLELLRPIYLKTAAYGHFGRDEPEFTWEAADKAMALKADIG